MNHKISFLGLILSILITFQTLGQNINKIEFFVDIDPGFGLGTNVPISPILQREISNLSFNVPVGSLSVGSHKLYIRGRFDDGKWGVVFEKTILNNSISVVPAIVKAEYFINTDPGFGLGVNIPITAGQTTLTNVAFNIPTASLTAGTDFLFIRTKDELGKWSEVLMKQLDNVIAVSNPSIVQAEYFINTDPGFSLGINIPITGGQTTLTNVALNIPTANLTSGTDFLFVRTKDEKGKWSEVLMKQLENVPVVSNPAIVKAEYFINTDPGFGLGINIPITGGQTTLTNVAFNIPTASLTAGTDFLFVRTKDEKGKWSEVLMKQLENVPVVTNPTIVKAEYFINTDPGFGLGVNIPITAGQTTLTNVALNIPTASLTAGTDFLFIRTKDEVGKWSEVLMKQLENVPVVPNPSIVQAEYFINTDPGFGLGVNIPITAGQTTLTNVAFNIPTANLTSGTDFLFVRTKDELGKWSEVLMKQLDNVPFVSNPTIVKAEYFINTDPGFGLGINIPITTGQISLTNVAFNIPLASLTADTNFLFIRTKDELGKWSEVLRKQLDNIIVSPNPAIVKAEYFINTDPGFGLGINIPITTGQTTLSNVPLNIPVSSLTAGTNFLFIRTKDEKGKWSEVLMKQLDNIIVNPNPAIVQAEYFINTDPGFGLGINIPITGGQTTLTKVAFNIPTANLTSGTDFLFVRTKDEKGKWGEVLMKQLDNVPNLTPSIVKTEYFLDTDPGFGFGIDIPISVGQTTLSAVSFNLNYGGLSSGEHSLWIRAKDENNKWGIVAIKKIIKTSSPILANATPNPICVGGTVLVDFNTNVIGPFTYTAFISNSIGSFTDKIPIGSITNNASFNTINGIIPSFVSKSNTYRIRVESSGGVTGIETDYLVVKECVGNCNQIITLVSSTDDYNSQNILKESNEGIIATNIISGTSNVSYKSSKSILLIPQNGAGFVVNNGSVFKAEIGGCNN